MFGKDLEYDKDFDKLYMITANPAHKGEFDVHSFFDKLAESDAKKAKLLYKLLWTPASTRKGSTSVRHAWLLQPGVAPLKAHGADTIPR